jgi:hypothetical protein
VRVVLVVAATTLGAAHAATAAPRVADDAAAQTAPPPTLHPAPQDSAVWSLQWSQRSDDARPVLGQPVRPRRQTLSITRRLDAGSTALLSHEFRDLDLPEVDGVAPDTNSFVHRLTAGWQQATPTRLLRLAGSLAVSSNALKNAGDLDVEDLRPALAFAQSVGRLWLALYADDRLGRTLLYPGVAFDIEPAPGQQVQIGFPEATWRWQVASRWRSLAAVEPDGACWRVRDRDLERRTEVCSRSWVARWALHTPLGRHLAAEASAGYRFGSTLAYTLRDGREVQVDVPSGPFYGLGIGARF